MKIKYNLIWMGPIDPEWIAENGEGWTYGRVDVFQPNEDIPLEYSYDVPCMKREDFATFSTWMISYDSDTVETLDTLISEYESVNPKIRWK